MNTESFLEWVLLDWVEAGATPPFSLRLSKAPVLTEGYLTLSPKTTNQEIVKYSWVSGSTVTITDRWYDSTWTTKNVSNQKKHSKNTSAFKWALNHIIIDEKVDKTTLASIVNWEGASTVWIEDTAGYFASADVEWALAELAAWAPWVADASETVAGKVELPTDAEVTAWTVTWATGATLTPTNAQLNKSISLKGSITTTTDTDEYVVNQWGVDKRITQTNLRTQLAGDETKLGTAQKASDAEAIAWVENTKYITSKQAKDNYGLRDVVWHSQTLVAATTTTFTVNHSLGRVPYAVRCVSATSNTASAGFYDWTTQSCTRWGNANWLSNGKIFDVTDTNTVVGNITAMSATDITIQYTNNINSNISVWMTFEFE